MINEYVPHIRNKELMSLWNGVRFAKLDGHEPVIFTNWIYSDKRNSTNRIKETNVEIIRASGDVVTVRKNRVTFITKEEYNALCLIMRRGDSKSVYNFCEVIDAIASILLQQTVSCSDLLKVAEEEYDKSLAAIKEVLDIKSPSSVTEHIFVPNGPRIVGDPFEFLATRGLRADSSFIRKDDTDNTDLIFKQGLVNDAAEHLVVEPYRYSRLDRILAVTMAIWFITWCIAAVLGVLLFVGGVS